MKRMEHRSVKWKIRHAVGVAGVLLILLCLWYTRVNFDRRSVIVSFENATKIEVSFMSKTIGDNGSIEYVDRALTIKDQAQLSAITQEASRLSADSMQTLSMELFNTKPPPVECEVDIFISTSTRPRKYYLSPRVLYEGEGGVSTVLTHVNTKLLQLLVSE
jgi:hypothetical protein